MASPTNDDKSNITKLKKKSEEKTPIWKTFLKSVIVFILMILCGAHFISLTRLTDNQLDFMFPDKIRRRNIAGLPLRAGDIMIRCSLQLWP